MIFETKIKELSDRYFADARAPDIAGFVDQLFHVAAETGAVACAFDGDQRLRFFVRPTPMRAIGQVASLQSQKACVVEHEAARSVLRMICARLGVICGESTDADISPYGDKAVMEYDVKDHKHWSISFTNTSERQEFVIEAV
jgi:hypothetical protein